MRSAQRLSSNFSESLHVARTLLQKLKDWYSALPVQLKSYTGHFTTDDPTSQSISTSLHFAYVLLEIFIFRALLRPLVRSATPPPLFEEDTESLPSMEMHDPESFNLVDDYISQIVEAEEIEPVPAIEMTRETGIGTVKAAENCAAIMLRLVMRMVCSDLAGFWYSCTPFPLYLLSDGTYTDTVRESNRLRHRLEFHATLGRASSLQRPCNPCKTAGVHVATGTTQSEQRL